MNDTLGAESRGDVDEPDDSPLSDLSSPRDASVGAGVSRLARKHGGPSRQRTPETTGQDVTTKDTIQVKTEAPVPELYAAPGVSEFPISAHANTSGGDREIHAGAVSAASNASGPPRAEGAAPAASADGRPLPVSQPGDRSQKEDEPASTETQANECASEQDGQSAGRVDASAADRREQPPDADIKKQSQFGGQFREKTPRAEKREPSQSASLQSCSQNGLQPATAPSSFAALTDRSEPPSAFSVVSSQATTPARAGPSPTAAEPPLPASAPKPSTSTAKASGLGLFPAFQGNDGNVSRCAVPCSLSKPPSNPPSNPPLQKRTSYAVRPKASIPTNLAPQDYAGQCIAAAESSRLNPYALHDEEHAMLRQHISQAQATTYLNIRNGILRLWLRKPHVAVTRNEAVGCARDRRWFDAASLCFDWLVRRGYVNYGCVEFKPEPHKDRNKDRRASASSAPSPAAPAAPEAEGSARPPKRRRKRIVVVGAGMAGLGCARQLHNLFVQYGDRLGEVGVEVPDVVVLEGRSRVGGRVYSRPFHLQPRRRHPDFEQSRCTAEMGGMIITGFDRGNPMNVLVRGQLGLGYHALVSTTTLYDTNGKAVDAVRDGMVENLFNECLDRVSEYKFKVPLPKPVEGSRRHINEGRDASSDSAHRTMAAVEDEAAARAAAAAAEASTAPTAPAVYVKAEPPRATETTTVEASGAPEAARPRPLLPGLKADASPSPQVDLVPVSSDRLTGRAHLERGTLATLKAAHKVRIMGWELRPGVAESRDLDLDPAAQAAGATLGAVVEEAIRQYGDLVRLDAQDFRLLNWHIANLEYSNAINHSRLSLQGWDIDAGNEWEGKHSMVVGGYQSVPRGLLLCPTPLDVRCRMVVTKIAYQNGPDEAPAVVQCENGDAFEADYVVNTLPLGVLKHGSVDFAPPLPAWKTEAIGRLGFGVLNKLILTYRQPFWDTERDIFGVLREPASGSSLRQTEYSQHRGRMFQWFNVSKTTGIPCLVALIAGDAAYDAEKASNDDLVDEATSILRRVFGAKNVPVPIEAVVTRWASDPFSRGSYSSAGPDMKLDDYDVMARPVGRQLYFAGEHTIGTHPATVHGAYLSGLRAAAEIFEQLVGPVPVPTPLVAPKETAASVSSLASPFRKRKRARDEEDGPGGDESSGSGSGSVNGSGSGSVSASGSGSRHRDAKASSRTRLDAREECIQEHIRSQIGSRPTPPQRVIDTSYLLFSKANYERARKKCEEGRRPGKGRPLPNEVRVLTSKMWRSASAEERRPFAEQAAAQKQLYEAALAQHNEKAAEWDRRAAELRTAYEQEQNGEQRGVSATMPQRGLPSAPGSATALASATPDRAGPSTPGSRRLRRTASQQAEGDAADVDAVV